MHQADAFAGGGPRDPRAARNDTVLGSTFLGISVITVADVLSTRSGSTRVAAEHGLLVGVGLIGASVGLVLVWSGWFIGRHLAEDDAYWRELSRRNLRTALLVAALLGIAAICVAFVASTDHRPEAAATACTLGVGYLVSSVAPWLGLVTPPT